MKVQRHFGCFVTIVAFLAFTSAIWANPFMGEYKGTYHPDGMITMLASAQVIAEGDDVYYRIVIKATPNEENQDGGNIEIHAKRKGSTVHIGDRSGGYHWSGQIQNGHLSVQAEYGQHFELDKFERKAPKEGLKPPQDAVVLLPFKDGVKPDTSAWTNAEWKSLDNGAMQVNKGDNNTKEQFGDIENFHLEFKLPLEPGQTYDVKFRAPRLNADGSIKENARITVFQNGIKVQDDVEIPYSGNRWKGKSEATGPIHLQDHGHPIQYRNIWLVKGK